MVRLWAPVALVCKFTGRVFYRSQSRTRAVKSIMLTSDVLHSHRSAGVVFVGVSSQNDCAFILSAAVGVKQETLSADTGRCVNWYPNCALREIRC